MLALMLFLSFVPRVFDPPGHFLCLQPSRDARPAAPGEQPSPDSPTSR